MKNKIISPFFICFLLINSFVYSNTIIVGNTGDYPNLSAASNFMNAGDTVLLQNQIFNDGAQFLNDLIGSKASPIVIKAMNKHQAIFRGGSESIHLVRCMYLELDGFIFERQTGNGVNIDDGGIFDQPSRHITIRNCIFRDMDARGNNDQLKMSGIDSFLIEKCDFLNGANGGSAIDFVGCHWGTIQDCNFDNAGSSGIQNKGGTHHIRIQRCKFKNIAQRALNLGGSTSLRFFRPPLSNPIVDAFEAADIEVFSNVFVGCLSPIAYVGCVRVKVYNNTFYNPDKWAIRILQETTVDGFLTCGDNEFVNNIVYLDNDITEVNIGPNTDPGSFIFSNNLWYNANDNNWTPTLPVQDIDQVISNPLFIDTDVEDFNLKPRSPAIKAGLIVTAPSHDYSANKYFNPPSVGAFEGFKIFTNNVYIFRNSILISPNPVMNHQIIIKNINRESEVNIFNVSGQLVQGINYIKNNNFTIVDNIPKGIFFIQIRQSDQKSIIKKLVSH